MGGWANNALSSYYALMENPLTTSFQKRGSGEGKYDYDWRKLGCESGESEDGPLRKSGMRNGAKDAFVS